jgi:hypothetical protein
METAETGPTTIKEDGFGLENSNLICDVNLLLFYCNLFYGQKVETILMSV